jgi:hypothetical protein
LRQLSISALNVNNYAAGISPQMETASCDLG